MEEGAIPSPQPLGRSDLQRGEVCAQHLVERGEGIYGEMQSESIWSEEGRKGNGGAMALKTGRCTALQRNAVRVVSGSPLSYFPGFDKAV
jgi:hypothetical protein